MISVDEDDVLVGKRLISVAFNPDGSIKQVDSTDCIYESFENAFEDIENPMRVLYGGITDDTISEEFKGNVKFKRNDFNSGNDGHGTIFDVYKNGKRAVQYAILPVISNKLHYIIYRGQFIRPFNIDKYIVVRKDKKELSIKKSLDLALSYIDTYLILNPEWQ